jgi:hypothetical protein
MFRSIGASAGKNPIEFKNLYNRNIMEPPARAGVVCHGWRAFGPDLGSKLSELEFDTA